jgi:hypothetical protein
MISSKISSHKTKLVLKLLTPIKISMSILTYEFKQWKDEGELLYYFEIQAFYRTLLQLIDRNVQLTLWILLYLFIPKPQRLAEANGLPGAPNLK